MCVYVLCVCVCVVACDLILHGASNEKTCEEKIAMTQVISAFVCVCVCAPVCMCDTALPVTHVWFSDVCDVYEVLWSLVLCGDMCGMVI